MMNRFLSTIIIVLLVSVCTLSQDKEKELIIFHAGSLTIPMEKIIKEFKTENPKVTVLKEIAGSRTCARKISELHKECDIFFSADYNVIDNLLIPDYADWNIKFATNEMAIVFTGNSKCSSQINKDNWYKILLNEDVNFGRSDPNSDPCGYRTILTIKLAEEFYNETNLSQKLLSKNIEYIRPKEVDLLALLESNETDYIFLYRSVAVQHGLNYLVLPDDINLKSQDYSDHYKTASVKLTGKMPGEKILVYGEPMIYGFTVPKNAPNRKLVYEFIHFVLDNDKGIKILEECGQLTVIPSLSESYDSIPDELKQYAKASN